MERLPDVPVNDRESPFTNPSEMVRRSGLAEASCLARKAKN
jgi:hypothetical protein